MASNIEVLEKETTLEELYELIIEVNQNDISDSIKS